MFDPTNKCRFCGGTPMFFHYATGGYGFNHKCITRIYFSVYSDGFFTAADALEAWNNFMQEEPEHDTNNNG